MPQLIDYIKALAYALDDLAVHVVASGSTSTVTVAQLIDTTPSASTNQLDHTYIYNQVSSGTAAGQQVMAEPGSFVPSTGATDVTPTWTAPATSSALLFTKKFPIRPFAGTNTDYYTLINRALSRLLVVDRISIPIVPLAMSYSLATWAAWLDREERLSRVLEPGPTGGRAISANFRRWNLEHDAETPTLELAVPFASGASGDLTLAVLRPANTWIKTTTAGSWAESTTGLTLDVSEARPPVNDVLTVALMEAYRVLMHRSPGRPNGAWTEKYEAQLALCRGLRWWDPTQDMPQAAAPVEGAA